MYISPSWVYIIDIESGYIIDIRASPWRRDATWDPVPGPVGRSEVGRGVDGALGGLHEASPALKEAPAPN